MPAAQSADDTNRASFNEIVVDELRVLRPELAVTLTPKGFPAGPVTDAAWDENAQQRADNLRDIYRGIATLGDPEAPPTSSSANNVTAPRPLAALCLSGGGIRSATFNLGVLQALAKADLLKRFDYLSSVSGGGYIASWLQAWMHQEGGDRVMKELAPKEGVANPLAPEPRPIDNLRAYSNYLTPKLGLFSGDTWTAIAMIVRNILLNWLVILPLLAIPIAIPQFLLLVVRMTEDHHVLAQILLKCALLIAVFASITTHWFRRFVKRPGTSQVKFVMWCLLPIVLAASTLATATLGLNLPWSDPFAVVTDAQRQLLLHFALMWCVLVPIAGWTVSTVAYLLVDRNNFASKLLLAGFELLGLVVSGAVAGWLLMLMTQHWLAALLARPPFYVVCVLPILLGLYLVAKTLFVAFAGLVELAHRTAATNSAYDLVREWWGRLSGLVLLVAVGWGVTTVICILGTDINWLVGTYTPQVMAALGGVSGIATALLGASAKTGRKTDVVGAVSIVQKVFLALAAPVFAMTTIVLIAMATAEIGAALLHIDNLFDHSEIWQRSSTLTLPLALKFAAYIIGSAALLTVIMTYVVNINRFSLHGFYRNRLIRAFLGASNSDRKPDPFTGFAETDNIPMSELSGGRRYLLPVINVALNLVKGGDKLAWQQRKAESFSMTPLYCGNFYEGYRRTENYGGQKGISLGTAMTISGAAANPNMGYHSSPAMGFLLTLLNARLGVWLGNTNEHGKYSHRRAGPLFGLGALLGDLFGLSDASSRYVNLSDGGHFDNLGLYEMVLRRCRYIVVSDAGCDPDDSFEDLGNAIRKIRIDFGIPIEFEQKIVTLARSDANTGLYCAKAIIRYDQVDGAGAPCGVLVYVKPTLRGKGAPLPYDVYSYAQSEATFPHESTNDQWFSESQFESYRELGYHTIGQMTGSGSCEAIPEFIKQVDVYIKGSTRVDAKTLKNSRRSLLDWLRRQTK